MRPYTPAATRYLWAVIVAGWATLFLCLWKGTGVPEPWGAFALLTLLGAVSHLYPVRTAQQKARIVVANTFVFTAVLLLNPLLLVLHCGLVMLPFTLRHLHRPRIWYGYAFNSAQTALSALTAHQLIAMTGGARFDSLPGLLVISAAAAVYTIAQGLLVACMISLNNRVPLLKADTLTPRVLLAEVIQPYMGVVVGALWIAMPWVLAVLPVPVLVMYMLVRQVHLVQTVDIDPKTGLYNYKYLQHALAEELERSRWGKRPLAVLFADMDYLRSVNNQWGHLAGDEVLVQLAEIIRHQVRPGDLVARFGGEEFVVMLPGTDMEEALYMAEAIRAAVAGWEFAIGGGRTIHCTISIGAACAPLHGNCPSTLVDAADTALYQAKAGGRNRVVRAGEPVPAIEAATHVAAAAQATAAPPVAAPAVQAKPAAQSGSRPGDLLLGAVVAGAVALLAGALLRLHTVSLPLVAVLMALGAVAEQAKVRVYEGGSHNVVVSLSHAVTLAAAGTVGFPAAVLSALAGAAAHDLAAWKKRLPIKKRLFNLFMPVLSGGVAALLYTAVAGPEQGVSTAHLLAGAAAALTDYAMNTGGLVLMISLMSGRPFTAIWRENLWFAPAFIFLGLIGAFVGTAFHAVGWMGALLFITPVLILKYTFSLYSEKAHSSFVALEQAKAEVERAHAAQKQSMGELIDAVSAIIDARDNSTYGHSRQVARYAVAIAREMGVEPGEVEKVRVAALLHDLGKVGVPEAILKKPARLTDEEYATIKEHAILGERILSEVSELDEVARMVGEHHEKVNGTGYPRGKTGSAISLGGRIIAAADALDSMLSDRPYSRGRPLEEALAELVRCAATHFDPQVVAAIHRVVEQAGPGEFVNSAHLPGEGLGEIAV